MNVLSLFDGISCGQIALNQLGLKPNKYFASEIDNVSIKVTQSNYPNTLQIGDIRNVSKSILPKIDLLIGGSSCQDFSFSGSLKGLSTKANINILDLNHYIKLKNEGTEFYGQSFLFWEYVRLLKELKPKYFMLENVKMQKKWQDVISNAVGVEPIFINSKDFSAQSRGRFYWTNIPQKSVSDNLKSETVSDILDEIKGDLNPFSISDNEIQKQLDALMLSSSYKDTYIWRRDLLGKILVSYPNGHKIQRIGRIAFGKHKTEIITVVTQPHIYDGKNIRKISATEAERCQTVPHNYTLADGISDGKRRSMLGNGWTVEVIKHILKGIH